MLRSYGNVQLNRSAAPNTSALFRDDMIETQKNSTAQIDLTGSAAAVSAETMLQFEGDELVLDHGSLTVNTSRGLRVRVGCVTVTPVNPSTWTRYDVADVDGKVKVFAAKNDVYLDARRNKLEETKETKGREREIVRETEHKSRTEKCGAADDDSDRLAGKGPWMNSPWLIGAGAAAVGGLTVWVLSRSDDPVSPTKP